MLKEKPGHVAIWIGTVPKQAHLTAYLNERRRRNFDQPMNRFAADCGVTFYDHDNFETGYSGNDLLPIAELLDGTSYWRSFSRKAERLAAKAGISTANTVFLMFDKALAPNRWPEDALVKYLGSVPYSVTTPIKRLPLDEYTGHQERVMSISFAPNSSLVVTGDNNGSVLAWDSTTGIAVVHPQQIFTGTLSGIDNIHFDPGHQRCVLSSWIGARIWKEFPSNNELGPTCAHNFSAQIDSDAKIAFIADSSKIRMVDLDSGKVCGEIAVPGADLLVLPNRTLLCLQKDGTLTVWDFVTSKRLLLQKGPLKDCHDLTMASNGSIVVAWNLKEAAAWHTKQHHWVWKGKTTVGDGVRVVAAAGDQNVLVAPYQGKVEIWNCLTGSSSKQFGKRGTSYSEVYLSNDGRFSLLIANNGASAELWDTRNAKRLAEFDSSTLGKGRKADGVSTGALSTDGSTVVLGTFRGKVLFLRRDGSNLVSLRR